MVDTYKIFCECPNKKELYNRIANHYQEESTVGGKIKFTDKLRILLNGPLSVRIQKANKVRSDIISPYNVYCPRNEYESMLDEIDIDFNDKDFHWL